MTAVKERLIGAITMMDDTMAESLWHIVVTDYAPRSWNDIPEVEPDEADLRILKEIENDPECHEFLSNQEIDWNE